MIENIFDQINICVWAKDKNFKYIFCNEKYAEAANVDSPHQIIGKNDDDMPWRSQADYFREGDFAVLQGKKRINVQETEIRIDKVVDILVTENKLFNRHGQCIGLIGSYIEIPNQYIARKSGHYDQEKKRYYLGGIFKSVYLTWREAQVLKQLLLGYTAEQTGNHLGLSRKTVEGYINNIKIKLQVSTKGELLATAIQHGLTQILYLQTI